MRRHHKIDKPGKVRLASIADLDGRSNASKAVRHLVSAFTSDAGGEGEVSAARQQLITRAAMLSAMLADTEIKWLRKEKIEFADYLAGANTLRRVLMSLGLERRAKAVPDLYEYLRNKGYTTEAVPEDDEERVQ